MCSFPAEDLLKLRRWAAKEVPIVPGVVLIKAIDRMRWKHEEATKCDCWTKAQEQA